MKLHISISAKQVGDLYHYTNKQALLSILKSGKLALSVGRGTDVEHKYQQGYTHFASFTRSRFGAYHFKGDGFRSVYGDTGVMITFDGSAMSNAYKIVPVDFWGNRGSIDETMGNAKEVEERLLSNKSEVNILKYIKRIDFIQPGILGYVETYGFDSGKFKVLESDNERFPRYLGSIILMLKKSTIQYGFFDSFKDWALKRNTFSYIGKKEVHVAGPNDLRNRSSKSEYKELQCLLELLTDAKYEDLSEGAKKRSYNLYSYPTDIAGVFTTYLNNRKPSASPPLKKLADKIARVLVKRGFDVKEEVAKFIRDKYHVYSVAQNKARDLKQADALAANLIKILENNTPMSEWPEDKAAIYETIPKNIFSGFTDIFGYGYTEAQRILNKMWDSGSENSNKLINLSNTFGVNTANELTYYIYDKFVKR